MGDEIEQLREDIRVLHQLIAASHERAQETGNPDGYQSIFTQAFAAVLKERLEQLRQLEAEPPSR